MSDFERYRKRAQRLGALENLFIVTKRVFNLPSDISKSEKIRLLADLQEAIEAVEALPVAKSQERD